MGVMSCSRTNCSNIMCHTIIDGNYICEECLEEFRFFSRDREMSAGKWTEFYRKFIDSQKDTFGPKLSLDSFLDRHASYVEY